MELEAGEEGGVPRGDRESVASRGLDVKTVRLGIAGLLVVAAVVLGAIALFGGDSGDGSSAGSETNAVALSLPELLAEVSELGQPVFWAGPQAGVESYELSTTPDGRVYIRYLTGDAEAGDPRADFVTVGTYPVAAAQQALRDATKAAAGEQALSRHDGFQALSSEDATNAYVVYDDQPEVQIEIFSPQPGEAAELATSGALKPLG